jgi:hypothetical protein
VGLDPTTSCDDAAAVNDIQAVTLLFGEAQSVWEQDVGGTGVADGDPTYLPENIEQFFTLVYTSQFNAQYETPPISYWDTGATVQQALTSLPNFAVSDVQVTKMFPRDEGNDGRCAEAYFNEFQKVTCSSTTDCDTLFPSIAAGGVICDVDIQACVETDLTACVYVDGDAEFATGTDCAINFEIDGLYRENEDSDGDNSPDAYYWGHRLTSFERNCQAGKFSSSDSKYAQPCATDADCVPCAGFTRVTNGLCDGNTNVCSSYNTVSGAVADGVTAIVTPSGATVDDVELGCSLATFIIKFSDESTQGVQNDLICTIDNANSNNAGAAPKYTSDGIAACDVTHIGVPAFSDGNMLDATEASEVATDNLLQLCVSVDGTGGINSLATSMIASGDCTGDYSRSMDMDAINAQVQADDGDVKSIEGDQYPTSPSFERSLTVSVYTDEEIANALTLNFDTAMPCSNKGSCDYSTGICTCSDGYTGSSCGTAISYV